MFEKEVSLIYSLIGRKDMSFYALLNLTDNTPITAENAFFQFGKNGKIYFCPYCGAQMILKGKDGEKKHFFCALPSASHNNNCEIRVISFSKENFDENTFNIDTFFISIIHQKTISKNNKSLNLNHKKVISNTNIELKKIKTVLQLYSLCKNSELQDVYNNYAIWSLLLDNRSFYLYEQTFGGKRIIECNFNNYDSINQFLYCKINQKLTAVIYIKELTLFKSVRNDFYNAKNNNSKIIIFGDWKQQGCNIKIELKNKKQFHILK